MTGIFDSLFHAGMTPSEYNERVKLKNRIPEDGFLALKKRGNMYFDENEGRNFNTYDYKPIIVRYGAGLYVVPTVKNGKEESDKNVVLDRFIAEKQRYSDAVIANRHATEPAHLGKFYSFDDANEFIDALNQERYKGMRNHMKK